MDVSHYTGLTLKGIFNFKRILMPVLFTFASYYVSNPLHHDLEPEEVYRKHCRKMRK